MELEKPKKRAVEQSGKRIALEILSSFSAHEKLKTLEEIKKKSPEIAEDLLLQSLTIESLYLVPDEQLKIFFDHIKPELWGMALKESSANLKWRVLNLAASDYAEVIYQVLELPIQKLAPYKKAAIKKIMQLATILYQKKIITFQTELSH